MCSLGKRVRSLVRRNWLSNQVERNQVSSPNPSLNPSSFGDYCGRDGRKGEFCFKKKCEERMAKEWANKDRYKSSHGVPEAHMPLPRGKAIVRTVTAWGEKSALGERDPAGRVKSVRLVWKPAGPVLGTEKPVKPVPKPVRPV
jgi:hypothetical protein